MKNDETCNKQFMDKSDYQNEEENKKTSSFTEKITDYTSCAISGGSKICVAGNKCPINDISTKSRGDPKESLVTIGNIDYYLSSTQALNPIT